jgi:hypothetical protein
MLSNRTREIATKLATDAKATGFDLGDHYDADWNLTDAEWNEVCDLAEQLMPTIKVPASVYAAWSRVDADFRAEQQSQRRAFALDA